MVGPNGRADTSTLKILRSDDVSFTEALREWLPSATFSPARLDGREVRQLIEMPFLFIADEGSVLYPSDMRIEAEMNRELARRREQKAPRLVAAGEALFDYQVEQPVVMAPGSRGPLYPTALREGGVEGTVLAQFIVDTEGRADMGTFKVLRASHAEFGESVREAISAMRFIPATVGGKQVRQVVQQPFQFALRTQR